MIRTERNDRGVALATALSELSLALQCLHAGYFADARYYFRSYSITVRYIHETWGSL